MNEVLLERGTLHSGVFAELTDTVSILEYPKNNEDIHVVVSFLWELSLNINITMALEQERRRQLHGVRQGSGAKAVTWKSEEEDGKFEASLGYPVKTSQEKNEMQRCTPEDKTQSSFLYTTGRGRGASDT